jgi:hypothetical protein
MVHHLIILHRLVVPIPGTEVRINTTRGATQRSISRTTPRSIIILVNLTTDKAIMYLRKQVLRLRAIRSQATLLRPSRNRVIRLQVTQPPVKG